MFQSQFNQSGFFMSPNNGDNTSRILPSMINGGGLLDSEGFAVYSNVKFLYLIGKICCETSQFPEEGLLALNDYLSLLDYFQEDISEVSYQKLRTKTLYSIGMIFYK